MLVSYGSVDAIKNGDPAWHALANNPAAIIDKSSLMMIVSYKGTLTASIMSNWDNYFIQV